MGFKAFLSKPFAKHIVRKNRNWIDNPIESQEATFEMLIASAVETAFGKDHDFENIETIEDFQKRVKVQTYEGLRPYIDRMVEGEEDVLWPGKPLYWSKTSGTTSGAKYIPISKESIDHHINAARDAILNYVHETGNAQFVDGKMIFLQGSPEMEEKNGIKVGRLSGIVAHYVPGYLQKNRLPSMETNCIEDWEEKVDAIAKETVNEKMTLIGGIPPWVQMYFERLLALSGKSTIKEVFPDYSLFIWGGVNFQPYKSIFEKLVGKDVPSLEYYPASEGFIAYQNSQTEPGLLLNLDAGIFYEFIPVSEFHDEKPSRLTLKDVKVGVNYVIVLNTNAGLWGYNIGDTIEFVSTYPFKIKVTGRIKHFTSAFGEHVIAKEVEQSMRLAIESEPAEVVEFHVAPEVNPSEGLPYHEWLIEFAEEPKNLDNFKEILEAEMRKQNPYYDDLISGNILKPIVISMVKKDGFKSYMKSIGKLGGQNKTPRLANDRKIADALREKGLLNE